jgi:adenosylcobinamide-GDP ribazoletransferase
MTGMLVLVIGHSVSRAFAASFIWYLPYARADASSKVKPIAKQLPTSQWLLIIVLGLLPASGLFWQWPPGTLGLCLAVLAVGSGVLFLCLARLYATRIGGYTGDCLGAAQQLAELLTQAILLAMSTHYPTPGS